ncbi:MAG: transporter substrate-binding domain-containing protein [Muribaculaceae bacterium]|nr:transporter substrate-binding domain-containing protein [Muribaculaceae bacterium]
MKKRNSNYSVVAVITIIIVALGAIGYVRHDKYDSLIARTYHKPSGDTLAVAIEMSPLTYNLRNDTAEGFDYQLLRDISARHNRPISFHPVSNLEEAFDRLNSGKYDILVASMPGTETLKRYFPVTDAVYLDRQVLVQRRDTSAISSYIQLIGDTITVPAGSPALSRLNNMNKELGDTVFIVSSPHSPEQLVIMTAIGEVSRTVVNEEVAQRIAADYDNLDISMPISLTQFQCWAIAPGDTVLRDSLNAWLADFRTTPEYKRLVERYLR